MGPSKAPHLTTFHHIHEIWMYYARYPDPQSIFFRFFHVIGVVFDGKNGSGRKEFGSQKAEFRNQKTEFRMKAAKRKKMPGTIKS
jgi:hypothetical protein